MELSGSAFGVHLITQTGSPLTGIFLVYHDASAVNSSSSSSVCMGDNITGSNQMLLSTEEHVLTSDKWDTKSGIQGMNMQGCIESWPKPFTSYFIFTF